MTQQEQLEAILWDVSRAGYGMGFAHDLQDTDRLMAGEAKRAVERATSAITALIQEAVNEDRAKRRVSKRKQTEEDKLTSRRHKALPWGLVHCNRCNKDVTAPTGFTVFLGDTKKDDYSAHTDCLTKEERNQLSGGSNNE